MSNDPVSQMREYVEELQEINRTLNHGTQVLHDYITTLKAELDAARRDRARLEFIEQHARNIFISNNGDVPGWTLLETDWHSVSAPTLRDSIDIAVATQDAENDA